MDIFSLAPYIAMTVFFAVFLFIFVWMLIRRYGPVAKGKILGPHEIIGRKADGSCERFKANLVEVNTHNTDNTAGIKRVLSGAIDQRVKALKNEMSHVAKEKFPKEYEKIEGQIEECETHRKALETDDLSKYFRVIALRDGLETHLLLQWKYVAKSLNEYATPEGNKFTLSFGFQSKGVIMGDISDEKNTLHLPAIGDLKLGRFKLHYFVPDVRADLDEKPVEPPEYLARIALYVPASLELNEQIRSLNEQIRDKDRKMKEIADDLSAAATERDSLRIILQGFGWKDPQKALQKKRLDVLDLFLFLVPATFGYFVAQSMNVLPYAGMIAGLLGGSALVMLLRR